MPGTRWDTTTTRRSALALGGGAALAACAPLPRGSDLAVRVRARDWRRLAAGVRGTLTRPGDAGYRRARLVENPAFDAARPLAVLSVRSAADVATGLAFAREHGIEVALRSGGHSYPGWSAGDGRLVVDVRPLSTVRPTADGTGAVIGAGASLARVYETLADRGRGLAAGSCPTVGIAGLTQGGGIGIVGRAHGLTCDAVTAMRVVTAAGEVVTASAQQEPDLFWALRGGGGGHLGVVTSFTVDTFAAPGVSTAFLQWPLEAAATVLPAWQAWAPAEDARLWSTLRALSGTAHRGGPVLALSVTWTGPDAGLAAPMGRLLADVPRPTVDRRLRRSFRAVTRAYAGCTDVPVEDCRSAPAGVLARRRFAATSHVAYDPLPEGDVGLLVDRVADAHGSGLVEAGISLDVLGGRIADPAPGDTAFVHRRALATVQYTATHLADDRQQAVGFVRGSRAALTPAWGEHAYVNYADAAVADHRAAYFGANAARLAAVRQRYDPDGFFTQPQGY